MFIRYIEHLCIDFIRGIANLKDWFHIIWNMKQDKKSFYRVMKFQLNRFIYSIKDTHMESTYDVECIKKVIKYMDLLEKDNFINKKEKNETIRKMNKIIVENIRRWWV